MRWTLLGLVVLPALASPASAQGTGSYFCLRGAPPPQCRGFIRIEVRGGGSMTDLVRHHFTGELAPDGTLVPSDTLEWADFGDWIGAEVGYAVNLTDRWAVGASVALETGHETTRYMVRGRARRWLTGRLYAEALPGVFWQEPDPVYGADEDFGRGTGFTVEARTGLAGLLFGSLRYDVMDVDPMMAVLGSDGRARLDPGGLAHSLSVGGGLEGLTAILSTTTVLVIGTVAFLIAGGPIA